MTDVPCYVDDAVSTPVLVTGKARVLLPTDGAAPAKLSDFPGGSLPTGIAWSIAANASPRRGAFVVPIVPNTVADGDRFFDVEVYDVTPAGAQLVAARGRVKIVDNDVPSADPFPTAATLDTGFVAGGTSGNRLTTTLFNTAWEIWLFGDDNDGTPGYVIRPVDDSHLRGFLRGADGTETITNQQNYQLHPSTAAQTNGTPSGQPLLILTTPNGAYSIKIGDTQIDIPGAGEFFSPRGTTTASFIRVKHGGSTPRATTISKR